MLLRMLHKMGCANPVPMETATSMQSILMGLWLVVPFNTFDSSMSYFIMREIAPEFAWGGSLLVLGIIQLVAVHIAGDKVRWIAAIASLFVYMFLDVSVLLSGSTSLLATVLFIFVFLAGWSTAIYSVRDKVNCGD